MPSQGDRDHKIHALHRLTSVPNDRGRVADIHNAHVMTYNITGVCVHTCDFALTKVFLSCYMLVDLSSPFMHSCPATGDTRPDPAMRIESQTSWHEVSEGVSLVYFTRTTWRNDSGTYSDVHKPFDEMSRTSELQPGSVRKKKTVWLWLGFCFGVGFRLRSK